MSLEDSAAPLAKVVVHTYDGVIKGYCNALPYDNIADALRSKHGRLSDVLELREAATQLAVQVSLADVKAVFFVKQFEGQRQRRDLRFHSGTVSNGMWVEIGFADGERTEGIIENALHVLSEPGFFLMPTDPGSNNQLIYVLKHALQSFRVLGLRHF